MQQGIRNSPFLAVGDDRYGFVVETHDLATALAMIMVEETEAADRNQLGLNQGFLHRLVANRTT